MPRFRGNKVGFGNAGVEAAMYQAAHMADSKFVDFSLWKEIKNIQMMPKHSDSFKLPKEMWVLPAAAAADRQARSEMFGNPGLPQGFWALEHSCSLFLTTQTPVRSDKGSDASKCPDSTAAEPAWVIKLQISPAASVPFVAERQ